MSDHVTAAEQQAIANYMTHLTRTLGMPSWRIWYDDEPAPGDTIAQVQFTKGRYVAELRLCSDWMTRTEDDRRDTITHEVLHLLHRDLSDWVEDDLVELMHDHEHDRIHRQFKRLIELHVDHLALFMATTHDLTQAWTDAHTAAEPSEGVGGGG